MRCWNRAFIPCARRVAGAFHPKVWVLRFLSEDGAPLIRVAVLSRNLTFDRSWDIALASEASPKPKQQTAGSRPLAEFIRCLPELCAEQPTLSVTDKMRVLADEVARTRFPAPDGFFDDPVEFHVLGMRKRRAMGRPWQPISGGYSMLAVAPFLGSTALDSVAQMGVGERMLVSTREQLDKLPDHALAQWSRVCHALRRRSRRAGGRRCRQALPGCMPRFSRSSTAGTSPGS